jgi:hypothetical protein
MNLPEVGKTYRHYKGGLYRVIALAHHSETLEDLVVYEALYTSDIGQFWVRPASMWFEEVETNGLKKPRFILT